VELPPYKADADAGVAVNKPRPATSPSYKSYNSYNSAAAGVSAITAPVQSGQRRLALKEKGTRGIYVWLSESDYWALMEYAAEDAAGTAARKAIQQFLAARKERKPKR